MANPSKRTLEEIEQLVAGYQQSGVSSRQYGAEQGIKVSTLDDYRLRRGKRQPPKAAGSPTKLIKIKLQSEINSNLEPSNFCLVLTNGRRIESSWSYCEQELAKLIRLAEAV